jgi:zincin-like metallopeptidase toxin 4 of polymorphic toxin system
MNTTNNNALFTWDDEQDKNLFAGLFPQGLSAPGFPEADIFPGGPSGSQARKNVLASSPLSKSGKDIKENFFRGSVIHTYPGFEIIVDPSTNVDPKDKIKPIERDFYFDRNHNDIMDGDERIAFTVKLFISQYAKQLVDIYDDPTIQPKPTEILLFLENNKGDWSNTTLHIKKGAYINAALITKMFSANSSFTAYIQSQYNISPSDLEGLLRTGKVESNVVNLISCLFEITSFAISDPMLLKGVGKAIGKAVAFIKDNCLIDEKRWNPSKTPKGAEFEPFLFPGINNVLENIDDTEINKFLANAIKSLKKEISGYDTLVENALHKSLIAFPYPSLFPYPSVRVASVTLPKTFSEFLSMKYHKMRKVIDDMLANLEGLDFSTILEKSIHAINAFICGVWNGFIEAVCGIISLVQYLFEGAGEIADLLKNFKEKGLVFLEKVDDFILAFQNIDFGKIFSKLATGLKDMVLSGANSSLVEIAYFCGIFIGFVVELVIEIVVGILFTGGALTVEAIFAKLAEIPKAIGDLVSASIKGVVKAGQKTMGGMAQAFDSLLEFLMKGTDEILRIIDEVFGKFKTIADDLTKKFVDDVPNLSKSELDWMASRKIGNLGGKVLTASQIRKLRGLLKEKGIILIVEGDLRSISKLFKPVTIEGIHFDKFDDLLRFMKGTKPPLVGGFDAVNMQMILPKDATEIIAFHEMAHVKHFEELGETYHTLQRLQKESYVWKQILENSGRWTKAELKESLRYINEIREAEGLRRLK